MTKALEDTCAIASNRYEIDAKQLQQVARVTAKSIYESMPTYPFALMIGTGPFEAMWAKYEEGIGFEELRNAVPEYRFRTWMQSLEKFDVVDAKLARELAEAFPNERRKYSHVYPETYEVLDLLKQKKYPLLLLTNGSPDLQKEKLAGVPELSPYFDHIVISGEFGVGKPDEKLFRHALDKFSFQPEEVIMVGDKLTTDILGANLVGMPSVWINREELPLDSKIEPKYTITNLHELLKLVETIS